MPVVRHKSQTVLEHSAAVDVDPRIERSRAQIDQAFVAILHRRGYDTIRVSDITRKAKLGRATFYAHYATKHDLLQSQLRRIVWPMIEVSALDGAIDCTALFAHVLAAPQIYRGLLGGATGAEVSRMMQASFEQRLQALALPANEQAHPIPRALALRFMAATLFTLVDWAIDDPSTPTPADMQAMFVGLVGETLRDAV